MAKPTILTLDDDPEVLRSIERDLRRRYGDKYRILRSESGPAALEAVQQLKVRNDAVALFLVDQRMPDMSGVEFLAQAREVFPDAKRVLLTAYADTNAAIEAINEVRLDHYLIKPWDPPEQNLYPVIDDLLADWRACYYRPQFEGIRLLGNRWSAQTHQLKEFLGRNQVPFQWLDAEAAETDDEVRRVLNALGPVRLPVVVFPDGSKAEAPESEEIAKKIGLRTHAETNFYDFIIIGGGPAGLAAAVYGASEGLKTVLVEREAPGGQAGQSSRIENYLGFPAGLSGADLTRRGVTQARRFGVEMLSPQEAVGLRASGPYRMVRLRDGCEISCHSVLIATGLSWRTLNVPGIDRLQGRGIYYGAAITEAISCADEDVFVVGGANSAGQAAMHFSGYARHVTMLVRAGSLEEGMSQYLVEQVRSTPNIAVELNSEVVQAEGEEKLEAIRVRNNQTDEVTNLRASSLFIFIGAVPCTGWLRNSVQLDERGYILAGPYLHREHGHVRGWPLNRDPYLLETCMPGVFVAGDTRHGSIKRVASAVGEGSVSVQMVHQYLTSVR
jgi:thioredoxin reductase (NADPH)